MEFIIKIISYIVLVPALVKGCSIGYNMWKDSVHSLSNSAGNPNLVQLVIYCGLFTFLIWLAVMLPVYIFFKIWWLALIVGAVIFFIYKAIKNKKTDTGEE